MDDYGDTKRQALGQTGTLNSHCEDVMDELFLGHEFFDPEDLIQVKYEMLRRVRQDHMSVSEAAKKFGFSRVSYYQIQQAYDQNGLAGLMPRQRGPKHAHKLTETILSFVADCRNRIPSLRAPGLAKKIQERFGVSVHPRSIERALKRQLKKGL